MGVRLGQCQCTEGCQTQPLAQRTVVKRRWPDPHSDMSCQMVGHRQHPPAVDSWHSAVLADLTCHQPHLKIVVI